MSQAERKAKIDPTQPLPVTHQCKVLEPDPDGWTENST